MALLDDLKTRTDAIVKSAWDRRDGTVVPEMDDLGLGNEGVDLEATFLYADLADSTELAIQSQTIAAEVFKAYLMGTTRIIRSLGGEIRSFDGDRVMGVFIEGAKNTGGWHRQDLDLTRHRSPQRVFWGAPLERSSCGIARVQSGCNGLSAKYLSMT